MPHLTTSIAQSKGPFHTYEFFPPRTEAGLVNLLDRIRRLAATPLPAPLAVSVTWGAGGGTAERSLELAEQIVKMGLDVILHLTCTNMRKEKVDQALAVSLFHIGIDTLCLTTQKCRALGIHNVLALRGDPPRSEEYAVDSDPTPDFFNHADDLVRYIKQEHGNWFCIGVAGYPTPHQDSEDVESDLHWLKIKCDAGAEFIITQLFYDVDGFERWVKAVRAAGELFPALPVICTDRNRYHSTNNTWCNAHTELCVI